MYIHTHAYTHTRAYILGVARRDGGLGFGSDCLYRGSFSFLYLL